MTASIAPNVAADTAQPRVFRVEVSPKPGEVDAGGAAALPQAQASLGHVTAVHSARIFLIEAPLDERAIQHIADELLTDPVNQMATIGASPVAEAASIVEVHYLPGVMDPVAQSTREAIAEMLPQVALDDVQVRTGVRYDFMYEVAGDKPSAAVLHQFAERALANTVVQAIHEKPFWPGEFSHGHAYEFRLTHVPLRELDDAGLLKLSREGHLFLSLAEMRAIRDYYRNLPEGGREPTDIELETLAQTWSEHCVHKTLKSTIRYCEAGGAGMSVPTAEGAKLRERPGHTGNDDGSVTINNLLKSTVAAATVKLMESAPHKDWCISVFKDNAGIVRFDDEDGVCIKVETHNHPSAIEPYGGAATGIGGCIRDVLGTGLAARPIANTDTFCVAFPDDGANGLPKGVIAPKRILQRVVDGVRDYGNRMGIPTVNGSVYFDEDFLGNPLVFAGCIGLIPLDKCFGQACHGDRIIALGGATGRDGIHGATFSSAELTDTHADEFSHAVQIGNAITQKKMLDVILQARDFEGGPLFSAITDCGAGGFSSAVGEMGEAVGAMVELDHAPLKYQGLSYTEIWISEAQERMVLAVPPEKVDALRDLCTAENVQLCDLGQFGCSSDAGSEALLVLKYRGQEVGRLAMALLHEGIPTPTREAVWGQPGSASAKQSATPRAAVRREQAQSLESALFALLAHPNIASKHWIVRQYDHEVQGGSVVKALVGPEQDGPSDAAVLRPKLGSRRGIALSCGMQPHLSEKATARGLARDGDSYWATLAAIDEAVRNAVCVGADPKRIAILDNFCWPSCDDPAMLGSLVRAAEACYDGALAYATPFVSGKDSLNNQFTTEDGSVITIIPTLLISALSIVEDVTRCRTMDAKAAGNVLLIVGQTTSAMGGSHYRMVCGHDGRDDRIPRLDLRCGPANAWAVAQLIEQGLVASAHDCSDGGLLVAAAEMAFAGRVGLELDLQGLPCPQSLDTIAACFAETPSRYLLEVPSPKLDAVIKLLRSNHVPFGQVGLFVEGQTLTVRDPRQGRCLAASLDELRAAWLKPLDW
jgi:phosphoribosylformylglycinamidine synthase